METSSLPDYPEKASPSMPVGASDSIRRRSGDRLVASLLRLGWIAIILGALAMLRSAALSASGQAQRHPPETCQVYGEWQPADGEGSSFSFLQNGEFRETKQDGETLRSGSFLAWGNDILVFNVLDGDGKPETRWIHHAESRIEELDLRVELNKDRLKVKSYSGKCVDIESGKLVDKDIWPWIKFYKRRISPPADPAIDKPIGAAP
jgi:hypothetical protein